MCLHATVNAIFVWLLVIPQHKIKVALLLVSTQRGFLYTSLALTAMTFPVSPNISLQMKATENLKLKGRFALAELARLVVNSRSKHIRSHLGLCLLETPLTWNARLLVTYMTMSLQAFATNVDLLQLPA